MTWKSQFRVTKVFDDGKTIKFVQTSPQGERIKVLETLPEELIDSIHYDEEMLVTIEKVPDHWNPPGNEYGIKFDKQIKEV